MNNFASLMAFSLGLNLSPLTRLSDLWEEAFKITKFASKMRKINAYLPLVANCKEYREALQKFMDKLNSQNGTSNVTSPSENYCNYSTTSVVGEGGKQYGSGPVGTSAAEGNINTTINANQHHESVSGEQENEEKFPFIPFMAVYTKDLTFINDGNSSFLGPTNDKQGNKNGAAIINFDKLVRWGSVLREIQLLQRQSCSIEVDEMVHNFLQNINFLSEETLWNISSAIKMQPHNQPLE